MNHVQRQGTQTGSGWLCTGCGETTALAFLFVLGGKKSIQKLIGLGLGGEEMPQALVHTVLTILNLVKISSVQRVIAEGDSQEAKNFCILY